MTLCLNVLNDDIMIGQDLFSMSTLAKHAVCRLLYRLGIGQNS